MSEALRETPLAAEHAALGARFVPFAGWAMPVQYAGVLAEHHAVRGRAGLFDLSHMAPFRVHGPAAAEALAGAVVTDPRRLAVGRAQYSLLAAADGTLLDDLIVYRTAAEEHLVIANAANAGVVGAALAGRLAGTAAGVEALGPRSALLALQGPSAATVLATVSPLDLAALRSYGIARAPVAGVDAWVARTGYTGEDGFELLVAREAAVPLWRALLAAGAAHGVVPCGLGARDTLRLEAAMPLFGQELDATTTPFEAGLGRLVDPAKPGPWVGREALLAGRDRPPARRLVGLMLEGRGIARAGQAVHRPGEARPCGRVTSGTQSPTLGRAIALAYLPTESAEVGAACEVAVRDQRVPARVVPTPFHQRPR